MKNSGLVVSRKTLKDPRNFSYGKVFGAPPLHDADTFLPESPVKDQLDSDECVAFSASDLLEQTEIETISPDWLFAKAKQLTGSYLGFGLDPKYLAKVATSLGAIEQKVAPFSLEEKGRDFVANWNNWPSTLDEAAKIHKQRSYFWVNGFDEIRAVLQQQKKHVQVGVYWQDEWIGNNIVPEYSWGQKKINPHAISVTNQRNIDGKLYLRVKNSYGKNRGDNGYYYFPKSQADNFIFGLAYIDLDPNEVKMDTWNILARMYNALLLMLQQLVKKEDPPKPIVPIVVEPKDEPKEEPKPVNTSKLDDFANAIKTFEGYMLPSTAYPNGSRSYQNRNPGNFRFTNLIKSLGAIKEENGFAYFPSYEVGWEALKTFVLFASEDKLKDYKDCTILSFCTAYAPSSDGNKPVNYANFIAQRVGVTINTKLQDFI